MCSYLGASLFVLVERELGFLLPWAVCMAGVGSCGVVALMVFLAMLVVGCIYDGKKGALEWK